MRKVRLCKSGEPNWTFSGFAHNAAGRLAQQDDDAATPADLSDGQRILSTWTALAREARRTIQRNAAGSWSDVQLTDWTYLLNGKTSTLSTKNAAGAVLESHTLGYESAGLYLNGHRTQDAFTLLGPDAAAPCRTSACTASWSYDARDRLVAHGDGHGGSTSYALDPAGNIQSESGPSGTRTMSYSGTRLVSTTSAGVTQRYWYDPNGGIDCVTLDAGIQADCAVTTGQPASARLLADYEHDYLDRLTAFRSYTTDGTTSTLKDTMALDYDALDRAWRSACGPGARTPGRALPLLCVVLGLLRRRLHFRDLVEPTTDVVWRLDRHT